MLTDIYITVPSQESFPEISVSSVAKNDRVFMKHYAPNRCLYIKVAKLRTGVGSAEMSHLQNRCLKISGKM